MQAMSRKRLEIRSRLCTVVQYAVLEAMTRVEKRKIRPPPRKYKMDKDIQTPPWIYDYVAELSCCAQSERNRLTEFCWGNTGSLSFFYTHTHRQWNKFFHLAYRSQIWKDLKHLWLKTRSFTPRCAFFGYRWWQIVFKGPNPKKNIFWDHSMQNLL